jgi:tetratricopeptide (TPR) repeat protein
MIEVLIVALGQAERTQILAQLPRHRRVLPSADDHNRYSTVTFKVPMLGQRHLHSREIAIVQLPQDDDPSTAMQRALERWQPKMVMVLGSAQALPDTDLFPGDVLVAERLFDADAESACLVKSGLSLAEQPLFKAVRDLEDGRWKALLESGSQAKRLLGTVAFSRKGQVSAKSLRERWQNAMALAKDSGSVLKALAMMPACPPFVGILALVDESGESLESALSNAVAFTLACLGKDRDREQVKSTAAAELVNARMMKAEAIYLEATAHLQRGQLDQAFTKYCEAIELENDYAEAYSNRGVVKSARGDLTGAIQDYQRALELKPDLGPAYYNLACAHGLRAKQQRDAENSVTDAPLADLEHALTYLEKALSYGFTDLKHLRQDTDLELLWERKEFEELVTSS